jgi:lysozyme
VPTTSSPSAPRAWRRRTTSFARSAQTSGNLPPAVDLELAGNCRARPGVAEVQLQLTAYINAVERRTQRHVLLYLGSDFSHRYRLAIESERPLWLRRFLRAPSARSWAMWQVDDRADVRGIRGHVDLDVGREGA